MYAKLEQITRHDEKKSEQGGLEPLNNLLVARRGRIPLEAH